MKTIKGTLNNLKIYQTTSVKHPKKMVFSIDNNVIQLTTNNDFIVKEGDEIIVAGVEERKRVFTAFSYRKIS